MTEQNKIPEDIMNPSYSVEKLEQREKKVRGQFWKKFRKFFLQLPFAKDLLVAYYCSMDPETPAYVRYILLGALGYFILPIDTIPDFIAGLGFSDDAAILAFALSSVQANIQPKHREAAEIYMEENGK